MITQIKLENFKSFEQLDIKLSNLNILAGANSAGKSSVIQALLLIKQNEYSLYNCQQAIRHILDHTEEKSPPVTIDFNKLKNYPLQRFIYNGEWLKVGTENSLLYIEANKEEIKIDIQLGENNSIRLHKIDHQWLAAVSPCSLDDQDIFTSIPGAALRYLHTNRISPEMTYGLSPYDIHNNNIGQHGEFCAHYLAEHKNQKIHFDSLTHKNSSTPFLLENVSNWLSEVSDGIDVSAKIIPEANQALLTYSYAYDKKRSREITPLHVGFGITHSLPIITQLLIAKPGDIIIIENPEAHLHPKGQANLAYLISLVASKGVQIILETHSDHILNAIRVATKQKVLKPEDSKIYFFHRSQESLATQTTEININVNGSVDKWPLGFFDEWDNQLDKLIW